MALGRRTITAKAAIPAATHDPATYIRFAKSFAGLAANIDSSISIGLAVGSISYDNNWTSNILAKSASQSFTPGFLSNHMYMQNRLVAKTTPICCTPFAIRAKTTIVPTIGSWPVIDRSSRSGSGPPATASNCLRPNSTRSMPVPANRRQASSTAFPRPIRWVDFLKAVTTAPTSGTYGTVGTLPTTIRPVFTAGDKAATTACLVAALELRRFRTKHSLPNIFRRAASCENRPHRRQRRKNHHNSADRTVYAVKQANGKLDLLVINKDPTNSIADQIQIAGFQPSGRRRFGNTARPKTSPKVKQPTAIPPWLAPRLN